MISPINQIIVWSIKCQKVFVLYNQQAKISKKKKKNLHIWKAGMVGILAWNDSDVKSIIQIAEDCDIIFSQSSNIWALLKPSK